MKISALISSAIMIWGMSQAAYGQAFNSSDKQVNLIELYTSEGCSSCPPADHWLSELKGKQGLWTDFIPVAFHVDYWDYIGWQDPYAHSRHTKRHYRYQENNNIRSVYTPAVVFNGSEWPSWRRSDLPDLKKPKAGQLNIDIKQDQLTAQYQTKLPRNQSLVLNIAILGFDLTSKVKKGENKGRTLKHEFVVLGYVQLLCNRVKLAALMPTILPYQKQSSTVPVLPWQLGLARPKIKHHYKRREAG